MVKNNVNRLVVFTSDAITLGSIFFFFLRDKMGRRFKTSLKRDTRINKERERMANDEKTASAI